ncbi:MAG TPA: invasin domain 3-containing protein, partial [Gaiellaceae bacterium]
ANGNSETTGGSTVTITRQSGTGSIGSVTDNGNGTYTATVTSPTAIGSGVFVATLGGNPVKSGTGSQTTSTITYVPGPADATQSTLTPTSSSITANGTATQVLTVQAKDANGNTVTTGGATVTITKQSGTATIGSVTDNGDGTYTATVTAPTATGSGVFVATLGGQPVKNGTGSQTQATVTYTPGAADATQSTLTPTSSSITADGSSTQVLTVQARDAFGNNLTSGGSTVTITQQSGTGSIGSVTDNGNGTYTAAVTAPTATGSGVFVATLGGNPVKNGTGSQTTSTITYVPGPADATQSTLTPTSSSITADGASTQVLTVQAKDANGNTVTTGGSTVTITQQSGTGSIGSVTDNGDGTYTATVTAPTATGSGVFVATLGGQPVKSGTGSQTQATVTYTPGAADATQSTLTPTSSSITADGSSTQVLTVQARDANGNNLTTGGATVTITKQSGTGTIGSVTDNGDGTYTATVTAPTATGSGVFVATLGGNPVKNGGGSQTQATVTYVTGAADATQSTLTPTSSSITADGSSTQVLTVTAKDAFGNNLTSGGSTVTITKLSGTGSIGSVTDNGDGTYTATVTAPTATGSGVFVATLDGNPVKNGTGSQTQATVTYTPGAATKLAITSVPANATVDTNFSVTVQSQDATGNCAPVVANTGISLASDGAGTLSGNTGTIAAATCSVTLSSVQTTLDETIHLTASRTSGDSLTTSAASSAIVVAKANFTTNTAVSVSGTPTVGTPFTATAGSYSPTPTGVSYQWQLCDNTGANCNDISGANSISYTPVAGDAGGTLKVIETVTKAGYNDGGSTSSASAVVVNGDFTTNTAVSINGTPKVGVATTVTVGSYTPTPTGFSYQWQLCDNTGANCSNIGGATNPTYTPVAGDVGSTLRVIETVSKPGYNNGGSTSSASSAVIKGDFTTSSAVFIDGQPPKVDTASTITNAVVSPAPAVRTQQWQLCDSSGNNCTDIGSATDKTYTPVAGDVGSTLRIVQTVTRPGYNDSSSTSSATTLVVNGDFTISAAVSISGTPMVDTPSTLTAGTYAPTPTSSAYQWQLCDVSGNNCADIGGADTNTYTPVASDAGSSLRVVETVSDAGYNDRSSTSAYAVVLEGSIATNTAVSINGTPKVATATTLTAGSYTPSPTSSSYQWQRCDNTGANCANINNATNPTYTPVAGDAGSTLRVVETASKAGYSDGTSTSAASPIVMKANFVMNTAVSVNGTPKVATATTLTAGSYTPTPASISYQWQLCDNAGASCSNIGGATSSTYTPIATDAGSTLRVVETVTKNGYNNGGSTSAASPVVIKASFTTTTAVAINGTPTQGTATTLTAGVYSPTPTSSSYQWRLCDNTGANCADIGGANSSAYTPVSTDVGSTLRVVETVSKAGYNDRSSTSSAVAVSGIFSTTTPVAINGTPKVGVQSTLTVGTYTPTPTGRTYQWRRCDTTGANCVNISGATNAVYTPVPADAGKTLKVVETVTKTQYVNGGSTSLASALVANGTFVMDTKVQIFGYPQHGVQSTITQGSYTPTPTSRSYQWMRCTGTTIASCTNISGATAKTYTPVAGDVGRRLRVIETVSANGYDDLSVTSDASTAVT